MAREKLYKNDALNMMVKIPKSISDQATRSLTHLEHINLNHYKNVKISVTAQHFQALVSCLREYTAICFESLEVRNSRPSKVNKNLKQLERLMNKAPVLVTNKLRSLRMTGIT